MFKKLAKSKTTIFIGLAALVALGFFGFWHYRDAVFSKEIVRLEILGPETAKMGDEVTYTVKYKNNGNFTLEQAKLIFELPENSLTEDSKTRLTQDLKDIYPGDENFVTFKTRLLGKEGDLKVAHATLSYVPHNLSARYESDTTFTTNIETVPITLTFDMPLKVEKNKEVNYAINYFSNVDYPLENLSVKIDSASGFTFISSQPASLDNVEWKLATLEKSQGGRINIKGTVSADAGNTISFSAHLGMRINGTFIVIKDVSQDVEVIQPLLFISQQINGSSNYVASPGETLHYQIFLRNIGSTPFSNLFVTSKLDGSAFDFSTLQSSDGQAQASNNLVGFDSKQVSDLQTLNPGQEIKLSFNIKLKDGFVPADSEKNNIVIKNNVSVLDVNQEFDTKVSSKIELAQKVYHSNQNGIQNSGPVPPQANVTTTYAVVWQVKDYLNDVKNVKVKAVLPQGVSLSDSIFPENQASNFSFDNVSREIVWLVGGLSSGASTSLTFQIALTPNSSQKGTIANLISQATISGEDQSTGVVTQSTAPGVNTSLPDDQGGAGGGIVQ